MFTITNAFETDIPLIRQLCLQVWPQTYSAILSKEQIDYMLEMMYSESSLKQQMQEGSQFILIYENDEPVGFASFQEAGPGLYKLHKIYVLPSQQGKGTGRFMLDKIINTIKENGAKALQLQVNRYNKAKQFYEKLGFSVIKEADFDIGNGYFMNDYVMEREL